MAKRTFLDTHIRCSRVDPSIRVATAGKPLHPVGLNCWISSKGKQIPCKDPSTGKKTVCFPYLHVEEYHAYPRYREAKR